jgi:hypothetical protein
MAFIILSIIMHSPHAATSRVENLAQVMFC